MARSWGGSPFSSARISSARSACSTASAGPGRRSGSSASQSSSRGSSPPSARRRLRALLRTTRPSQGRSLPGSTCPACSHRARKASDTTSSASLGRPRRIEPARPQAKPMSRSINSSRAEGSPRRRRRSSSRSSNHTTSLLRFRARSH
ncbi:Uncharacterised protein [Flavonifractor plautii]|uniref:Uncharacterized protein n=1 Tax=Flavonifractor plautii TaxID=292800 RepID=A0A174QLL3_FLAPL|nr:Uncharacterised protein [Flavonifractor plautii]